MNGNTKILVHTHGILVVPANDRARRALLNYCYTLAQWTYNKKPPTWKIERTISKIYAAATKGRKEFRFHRSLLDDILLAMNAGGVSEKKIEIVYEDKPQYDKVEFNKDGLPTPYKEQEPIIEHLSKPDQPIKVTNAQTGRGKTLMCLYAMANLGVRTVIQLRGGYVKRWIPDLEKLLGLSKKDMMVVRGSAHLMSLFNMAKAGELDDYKVIVITSKTIYNYLKEFEANPLENMYDVRPEDMYELLGVGLKVIDELHEDYHLNFKSDIYSNVANGIYMSATLDTKDSFRARMYNIAHPSKYWKSLEYHAYVRVIAKLYGQHDTSVQFQTSQRGKTDYSHTAYETSILKSKEATDNYLKIVHESFDEEFFRLTPFEPGQKLLIFFSLVDMCETAKVYFDRKLPDMEIGVYVSGSETKVLDESDIIISTVESLGTAMDIPGLKVICLTRSIDKFEKNEQIKGRLRKMKGKWENIEPILVYLVGNNIPKHLDYHENKLKFWKKLVSRHDVHTLKNKL